AVTAVLPRSEEQRRAAAGSRGCGTGGPLASPLVVAAQLSTHSAARIPGVVHVDVVRARVSQDCARNGGRRRRATLRLEGATEGDDDRPGLPRPALVDVRRGRRRDLRELELPADAGARDLHLGGARTVRVALGHFDRSAERRVERVALRRCGESARGNERDGSNDSSWLQHRSDPLWSTTFLYPFGIPRRTVFSGPRARRSDLAPPLDRLAGGGDPAEPAEETQGERVYGADDD